jgi:hypothetical protein
LYIKKGHDPRLEFTIPIIDEDKVAGGEEYIMMDMIDIHTPGRQEY